MRAEELRFEGLDGGGGVVGCHGGWRCERGYADGFGPGIDVCDLVVKNRWSG